MEKAKKDLFYEDLTKQAFREVGKICRFYKKCEHCKIMQICKLVRNLKKDQGWDDTPPLM